MRQRKIDSSVEKAVVTGMIVSTDYVKRVRAIYHRDLMSIPFARTVAQWCLDYFEQYERAPERHIADLFEAHQRNGLDAEQAELIADFLAALSDDFEHAAAGKFNVDFLLDKSEAHFEARNQELLVLDIKALHAKGDFKAAEELLRAYKRVERPSGAGIEPLTDEDAIRRAFDRDDSGGLFELPGAFGELVGPVVREDFIGILAPEKRGKSFRLLDIAMRGLRAGCNVAYFDAGDMSEDQIVRRIHTRNTRQSAKHWGRIKSPVLDCRYSQDDSCEKRERQSKMCCTETVERDGRQVRVKINYEDLREYTPCTYCLHEAPRDFRGAVWYETVDAERLTWQRAVELGKRTAERSRKRFKLSCHPNSTLTVHGMEAVLDRWEAEDGFVADLVCADYFDIFAAENPKITEARHQHDERWRAGRRFTQQRHCALITVTQADADSYDRRSLKLKNFSEAKSKYAHCTKFLALNQTADEKREMVIRVATLLAREDDFDIDHEVVIATNLDLGQPYIFSYWA